MARFSKNLGVFWCIALIVLIKLQRSDSEEVKESFEWKLKCNEMRLDQYEYFLHSRVF